MTLGSAPVNRAILDGIRLPELGSSEITLTGQQSLEDQPDIRVLIPNINIEGLTFAGAKSSVLRNVGLNNQTSFADILCSRILFQKEDWPSMIKDQVVVDLCAGYRPHGYYLACVGEAKAYIGVEAYVADSLLNALNRREELISDLQRYTKEYVAETGRIVKLIPKLVVAEDAATFIERITDNSVSIFTIGMHSLLEDEQCNRLDNAIPLALSNTGCIVAYPESICCGSKLNVYYQQPIYVGRPGV